MDTFRLALALVVLAGATRASADEPPFRIDDFEDLDLEAAPGLSWMAIGDWHLGGASTGEVAPLRLPAGERSRGALRLTAHLRKGASFPFAGVWTALRGDGVPRDITGYRAMRFRVRGTPGQYFAGVRRREGQISTNLMAPVAVTAAWAEVEVAFADLKATPPSAKALAFAPRGVGWIGFTSGADTPRDFELDIDDVELVPETTPPDPNAAWAVQKVKLTDPRSLDRLTFATIGREGGGDTVSDRLPDARELAMAVDAEGRVWFRFTLRDPPPTWGFGMNIALDVDGNPDNGTAWWGLNKAFHFDRLVTAYLARGAGYWQGVAGVADAAQIGEGRFAGRSADVRVAVDPARRTLAIGVPRAALGLPADGHVRLIGTVGSNMTYNDDLPDAGALDVVIPEAGAAVAH